MSKTNSKQRIQKLHDQMKSYLDVVTDRSPLFAGYVYEQETKCGKPQCKCAKSGYRHRQCCISFVEEGKSRTRVIPQKCRPDVEKLTTDYREYREARRKLVSCFEELLSHVDRLGQSRGEEGRNQYDRVVAKAKAGRSADKKKDGRPRRSGRTKQTADSDS